MNVPDRPPVPAGPLRLEIRRTVTLAVPLALTQLVQMAMGFVDVVMIGRLGPDAMAAGVVGTSLFFTLMLMCMGVVMAVNPMVAQAVGARDPAGVGRAVRQGLWLSILLAVPLMVVYMQAETLLLLAGQQPAVASMAGGYIGAILWGTLPNLWYTSLRGFAEGIGRPRPILLVTIGAASVNVFGNWVLMYGNLGAPALGLVGCGISSAIVMWVLFGGLVIVSRTSPAFKRYRVFRTIRRPDPRAIRFLFQLGWPIGVTFGLEGGLFLAATLLVGWAGTTALAAHQIALNAASVTFMIPLGIAMATTVRVGQSAGAGNREGAERAGWVGMTLGAVAMLVPALLFWLRPEWVVWVYTGGPAGDGVSEVAQHAALLLGIAAVFQLFDGVQVTAGGALRGLKETRAPMIVGFVCYWGVGLLSGYGLGFWAGYGAEGVWWGLTLGLAAASVGLTVWFRLRVRRASLVGKSVADSATTEAAL
jgi:multidrug resistance protein, MATE family